MDLTVKALEQFGMELVPGDIEFGKILGINHIQLSLRAADTLEEISIKYKW